MELRRQNVKDLPIAFAAANGLAYFKLNKDASLNKEMEKGWKKREAKRRVVMIRKMGRKGMPMVRVREASSPRGTRAISHAIDPIMQRIAQKGRSLLLLWPMTIKPL